MYCRNTDGKLVAIKKIVINKKCFTPDDIRTISKDGATMTLNDGTMYTFGRGLDLVLDLGSLQRSLRYLED